MPEATAATPATPTAATTPAPVAPQSSAPAASTPAQDAAAAKSEGISVEEYQKLRSSRDKAMRTQVELKRQLESKEKTWGAKLSKLDALEKREQLARLNPAAYLKDVYGDNWYEMLSEVRVSGGTPANLVAAEMQRFRDEVAQKEEAAKAEQRAQLEAQQRQQVDNARRQLAQEAADFYEKAAKDYPIFAKYGDANTVAQVLAQRIESEFHRSAQRDESGRVVRQGRVLTMQEVADLMEGELLGVAEAALDAPKYRTKLEPKWKALTAAATPGTVPAVVEQSQGTQSTPRRKTLNNSLTSSTAPETQPVKRTAEAKRAAAVAAFNAASRKA